MAAILRSFLGFPVFYIVTKPRNRVNPKLLPKLKSCKLLKPKRPMTAGFSKTHEEIDNKKIDKKVLNIYLSMKQIYRLTDHN